GIQLPALAAAQRATRRRYRDGGLDEFHHALWRHGQLETILAQHCLDMTPHREQDALARDAARTIMIVFLAASSGGARARGEESLAGAGPSDPAPSPASETG